MNISNSLAGGRNLRRLCGAMLLLTAFMACSSSSTDPVPDKKPVQITYSPQTGTVLMLAGESRHFEVTVTGTENVAVAWNLNDAAVGTGTQYDFDLSTVGTHDLSVAVTAGDSTGGRSWSVVVTPDESNLPPEVTGVTLEHGAAPGEVDLRWIKDTTGTFPIDFFLVAGSYSERITEENWDASDFIVEAAPGTSIQQQLVMAAPAYDIRPGEELWVAVRTRDDHGQVSHQNISVRLTVSTAWYLDVLLQDDTGDPLVTALISYDCGECVEGARNAVTGGDGLLHLGPFRSVDSVVVATNTSDDVGGDSGNGWYDYVTEPLGIGGGFLNLVLPGRYDLDLAACPETPVTDFMDYFQLMTKTKALNPADDPERRLLHRWADYPLRVFYSAGVLPQLGDEPLAPHARKSVAAWETALGGGWFTETSDSAGAQIVIRVDDLLGSVNGLTSIEPGRPLLGSLVPEQVTVTISDSAGFPNGTHAAETVLHEMGHALGLLNHSCISGKGNLMDGGGLSGFDLEALDESLWYTLIHATEWRAVRAIRSLPAAVPMAGYETE